eukprot:97708_1
MAECPEDPNVHIACSHLVSNKYFLAWRFFLVIYFWTLWISVQFVKSYTVNKYFTYWTLLLACIYISLSFYSTYLYRKQLYNKCIKYCQYSQKIQILVCSTSITVSIVFWALLFQPKTLSDPHDIQAHGITMICILIDFYISYNSMPFKSTWYYLFIYGLIYIIWSLIFAFIASSGPIYKVINWTENPLSAFIYGSLIIIITLIFHAILCWTNNKLMLKRINSVSNGNNNDIEMNEIAGTNDMGTQQTDNVSTKLGANLTIESVKIAENSDDTDENEMP